MAGAVAGRAVVPAHQAEFPEKTAGPGLVRDSRHLLRVFVRHPHHGRAPIHRARHPHLAAGAAVVADADRRRARLRFPADLAFHRLRAPVGHAPCGVRAAGHGRRAGGADQCRLPEWRSGPWRGARHPPGHAPGLSAAAVGGGHRHLCADPARDVAWLDLRPPDRCRLPLDRHLLRRRLCLGGQQVWRLAAPDRQRQRGHRLCYPAGAVRPVLAAGGPGAHFRGQPDGAPRQRQDRRGQVRFRIPALPGRPLWPGGLAGTHDTHDGSGRGHRAGPRRRHAQAPEPPRRDGRAERRVDQPDPAPGHGEVAGEFPAPGLDASGPGLALARLPETGRAAVRRVSARFRRRWQAGRAADQQ